MSIRVSSTSLITGAVVVGDPGLGVLAETVPSTGENGGGFLYPSLEFPADNGKEVRAFITRFPTNGTLFAYEDTSFTYDGTADSFDFQAYEDGVANGTEQTVLLNFGNVSPSGIPSGEAFGIPVVTSDSAQSVLPSGIVSSEAFGTATFTRIGVANVLPSGIASGEEFGTASVSFTGGTANVSVTGLLSGEAFGRPAVVSDAPVTALVFGASFEMLQMNRRREEARKKHRLS